MRAIPPAADDECGGSLSRRRAVFIFGWFELLRRRKRACSMHDMLGSRALVTGRFVPCLCCALANESRSCVRARLA